MRRLRRARPLTRRRMRLRLRTLAKEKHQMPRPTFFLLILAAASLAAGCATKLQFTSDPPGALIRVRGEGRASFRWQDAPAPTPTEMTVKYGRISAYAIWPEGAPDPETGRFPATISAQQEIPLSSSRDIERIHFVKPAK